MLTAPSPSAFDWRNECERQASRWAAGPPSFFFLLLPARATKQKVLKGRRVGGCYCYSDYSDTAFRNESRLCLSPNKRLPFFATPPVLARSLGISWGSKGVRHSRDSGLAEMRRRRRRKKKEEDVG